MVDAQETPPQGPLSDEPEGPCYCGRARELNTVELFCCECRKWCHGSCTSLTTIANMVPLQLNYTFSCKNCHKDDKDVLLKKASNFMQACITALANLSLQNPGRRYFSKDKDIIPFVEINWEILLPNRPQSANWHYHVSKALSTTEVFATDSGEEERGGEEELDNKHLYSLVDEDLSQINPLNKSDKSEPGKGGKPPGKKTNLGGKRKTTDQNGAAKKSKMDNLNHKDKLSKYGYPLEHPHNKDNYRYMLAEQDPLAGTSWEAELAAGKPLPAKNYRLSLSSLTLIALHDKAQQLKVSEDRLTVTGEKGYCLARATHSAKHGAFYFECTVTDMPGNSACRLGWGQQYGNLQAPCGYDKFSYSWRSRKGTRFHDSRGKSYSEGYGEGDVLGFYINLPKPHPTYVALPAPYKDQTLIKFKNYLYFEEKDESEKIEKELKPHPGSQIKFYKNGVCQGAAYQDVYKGEYFPTISLYKACSVKMNFGPNFDFPITEAEPASELSHLTQLEHTLADLLFHVEDRMNTPPA